MPTTHRARLLRELAPADQRRISVSRSLAIVVVLGGLALMPGAVPVAGAKVRSGFAVKRRSVATAGASCRTTYRGRIGVDSHLIWYSQSTIAQQLAAIRENGVTWVREDFPWDRIEPEPGVWNWSLPDALMTAAADNGINVLGILDYSATWASSDPTGAGNQYYPPKNFADYAAFARQVTARYGPSGSFWAVNPQLPRHPLAAEEIWNEPWYYNFWKPRPNPTAYASLALAAARAIHAEAPSMTVLAAGDLLQEPGRGLTDTPWLARVLTAQPSLAHAINGWSVHPYSSPWQDGPAANPGSQYSFSRVLLSRHVAVAHGATQPFWITEFGWSTAPATAGAISLSAQAADIGLALQMALDDWGSFVTRAFVYSWDTSSGAEGDLMGNFGLRNADGTAKPAWATIGRMVAQGSCGSSTRVGFASRASRKPPQRHQRPSAVDRARR